LEQIQLNPQTRHKLLGWYDVIIQQSYFSNNGDNLIKKDRLAMGAPTSGLVAEFFFQHLEQLHITCLSNKHKIIRYLIYVDDILVIYDANQTDVQSMLDDFNALHLNLTFTAETKTDNQIQFLDITIHRTPTNRKIAIHRKPTFTDTIIPYTSNQPTQQKYATVRFLYNRLNTYDLQKDKYNTDVNTIQNILHNNAFPIHPWSPPTLRHY
jgi:hypothetical protein